ncbi:hypothetical protein STEG23_011198 [Scotinomys teguina]
MQRSTATDSPWKPTGLNGMSPSSPSRQSSGNRREEERVSIPEGMEDTKRTRSPELTEQGLSEPTDVEAASMEPNLVYATSLAYTL